MSEHENFAPRITEVAPGEQMTLSHGRLTIIGREPGKAPNIDPRLRQKSDQVTLKIADHGIADYLSRAALLMLSDDGYTTVAVPHEASVGVTAYNLKNEPRPIIPGDRRRYGDGSLQQIDFNLNGRIVTLRLTGTSGAGATGSDQLFRLEIAPK
jgi:hypothetical protein